MILSSRSEEVGLKPSIGDEAQLRSWLAQAAMVIERAARGDLEARILGIDAPGDLGRVLHGINGLLDLVDAYVRESGAVMDAAKEGVFNRPFLTQGLLGSFGRNAAVLDRARLLMGERSEALALLRSRQLDLADGFESGVLRAVDQVAQAATELERVASLLSTTVQGAAADSSAATQLAEEADRAVAAIAERLDLLESSIRTVGQRADQSSQVAEEARGRSDRAQERVAELCESSRCIGAMVGMIREVAQQTNLLALNASIEAARAGQLGKGFAVVASEVKTLSANTRQTTVEIDGLVGAMRGATDQVVDSFRSIDAVLCDVRSMAQEIAGAVGEQQRMADEVHSSSNSVRQRTQDVHTRIGGVHSAATSLLDEARTLFSAAERLSRSATSVREEVVTFLTDIRS
jgi:methyl-accepting chemotaxis protein